MTSIKHWPRHPQQQQQQLCGNMQQNLPRSTNNINHSTTNCCCNSVVREAVIRAGDAVGIIRIIENLTYPYFGF